MCEAVHWNKVIPNPFGSSYNQNISTKRRDTELIVEEVCYKYNEVVGVVVVWSQ